MFASFSLGTCGIQADVSAIYHFFHFVELIGLYMVIKLSLFKYAFSLVTMALFSNKKKRWTFLPILVLLSHKIASDHSIY